MKNTLWIIWLCATLNAAEIGLTVAADSRHLTEALMQKVIEQFGVEVLLETGTYGGTTPRLAASFFKEIHTVELHHDLFLKGKSNLASYPNVYCYEGTSPRFIAEIAPKIHGRIVFWLDAHWCGGDTAMDGQNTPILREIEAIQKSGVKDSIILIDDIRCFHGLPEGFPEYGGYPKCAELKEAIQKIDEKYQFWILGDVAFAYPDDGFEPSQLVKACTASRLFDGKGFDPNVLEMDAAIRRLGSSKEAEAILTLQTYIPQRADCTGYHFLLWKGLMDLGKLDFETAARSFQRALDAGFKDWRVLWYLSEAEEGRGRIYEAKRLLAELIQIVPDFTDAKTRWEAL